MEYREDPTIDDMKFKELDEQDFLSVDKCCGGDEYFVCIVTPNRPHNKNVNNSDLLIS